MTGFTEELKEGSPSAGFKLCALIRDDKVWRTKTGCPSGEEVVGGNFRGDVRDRYRFCPPRESVDTSQKVLESPRWHERAYDVYVNGVEATRV